MHPCIVTMNFLLPAEGTLSMKNIHDRRQPTRT